MKLFLAGCSFSDYTKVHKNYGEILAGLLGIDYVHEGAGCGSNYRIWRTITNHILDKNLTSDDLLIVQYTNVTRNEFYSPYPNKYFKSSFIQVSVADKSHNNGSLIRYKLGSWEWQKYPEEKEFFQIYENTFLNENFELEKFKVNNYNFQSMLQVNSIPTIFLDTFRICLFENYVSDHFEKFQYRDLEQLNSSEYDLEQGDTSHMSQQGHQELAGKLLTHIKHTKIIKGIK